MKIKLFCLALVGLVSVLTYGAFKNSANTPPLTPTATSTPTSTEIAASTAPMPQYDHIFLIVEENKAYEQIIGNPNAPVINRLARTYGLASNYYGIVHPSEGNYVAMLGGSTFGIHDDAPFDADVNTSGSHGVNHTISGRSLLDQLEEKGLTWKGYFESIPSVGYTGTDYPSVVDALYASKHNGFINYKKVQSDPQELAKLVGIEQLTTDLQTGKVPNYSHIVFNQCNEMHGLARCPDLQNLIATGDTIVGKTVEQITKSPLWKSTKNNAIVITWDEDDGTKKSTQGCCGFEQNSQANFGGGHIATIVITNHGVRGLVDPTLYNHYSLLRTTEAAFGNS